MDIESIEQQIKEIQNGTRDLLPFNQPEHAGVCSAGPLLIGALIVCHLTRESLSSGCNASGSQTAPANWQIDEAQERQLQKWAEAKDVWVEKAEEMLTAKGFSDNQDGNDVNYISDRYNLDDMHPANIFMEESSDAPICIDCILKFRR